MKEWYPHIVECYEYLTPLIEKRSKVGISLWVDPYAASVPWSDLFSPIETFTWDAIRSFGRVPLYPQYPVGTKFIDFGNPVLKIGIECDGKEFHKNIEADIKRDDYLKTFGWTIYHISGRIRKTFTEIPEDAFYEDEKQKYFEEFYSSSIQGVIKAIAIQHFGYVNFDENAGEGDIAKSHLKTFILRKPKARK